MKNNRNNNEKKKRLSVTVGIPTCYGGESLITTVESLRASVGVRKFRLVLVADRIPISRPIKKQLKAMGVEVYWNRREGSQFKKLSQMIAKLRSDIFIFTQDDITFHARAIEEIVKAFEKNPNLTMIGARVLPLPAKSRFESIMTAMVRIVDRIGQMWNKADNHLLASGRCLAYRTYHLKKFRIPEKVVNGDMFLYLENRRLGGTFQYVKNAEVYIRCPQKISDQVGPSSRYQYSQTELANYFDFDITKEYRIPFSALLFAAFEEFANYPFQTLGYVLVYIYTRLRKVPGAVVSDPVWKVDVSTKNV